MQKVITIPRELIKRGELVLIPLSEYEEYLRLKKIISIVKATRLEKKAIQEGRQEIQEGKYLTLEKLENELANQNR